MLGNNVKKALREQKWLEYIDSYKNPSDTWSNIKKSVNNAIDEFPLLANLPKDRQEQLFTPQNIKKIVEFLFSINVSNSRKTEIAALLANHGINVCKEEYEKAFRDIPDIVNITSNYLDSAIKICNDISYKSTTIALEKEALEKNLLFLFNWNKALDRERNRFDDFISTLITEPVSTSNLYYLGNKLTIKGILRIHGKEHQNHFSIKVYPYDDKVVLKLDDITVSMKDKAKKGAKVERDYELVYEKKVKIVFIANEFLLYKIEFKK